MKKKIFISITSLSVIAALPISIISCASDKNGILQKDQVVETTLSNPTNKNLVFKRIQETTNSWERYWSKFLQIIKESESEVNNKYYQEKFRPLFQKYFAALEKIANQLNSTSELSQKIELLKSITDENEYQQKIDIIINDLKKLKNDSINAFIESYKDQDKNGDNMQQFKYFDFIKKIGLNFHFHPSEDLGNDKMNTENIIKLSESSLFAKGFNQINYYDMGFYFEDSDVSSHINLYNFQQFLDKENIMKRVDDEFKKSAIFAGKIVEFAIIRKLQIMSMAKVFGSNINDEEIKKSFEKPNDKIIQNITNSLMNKNASDFFTNIIPTYQKFKNTFKVDEKLKEYKSNVQKLLPKFYEKNKDKFSSFDDLVEKIEKAFIGGKTSSSNITEKGIVASFELIQKTLKSIELKTLNSIKEFNDLNLKIDGIWTVLNEWITKFIPLFQQFSNIFLGTDGNGRFFSQFSDEIDNIIWELKDKNASESELKPYIDFRNYTHDFWSNLQKSNEFKELKKELFVPAEEFIKWFHKFLSLSVFIDNYPLQLAIDNFDNIDQDDLKLN